MGINKVESCETCGLKWTQRNAGELCPVCTRRHRVDELEVKLARAERIEDAATYLITLWDAGRLEQSRAIGLDSLRAALAAQPDEEGETG